MADHDQRFKVVLQEFFEEFFLLSFPDLAGRLDFTQIEWLDKEVFADPPEGERRFLDVVAKLGTKEAIASQRPGETSGAIALVHIEVEHADSVESLRSRMYSYYEWLRRRHHLPVLPIALYLRVGLDGLGTDVFEESVWDLKVLHFQYRYAGLPALEALDYVTRDNWLGVALAALMRIPPERRAWLKAEALRRIVDSPQNDNRRFLLCGVVQAYLPLEGPQRQEYENLLVTKSYRGVANMEKTTYEKGLEQGLRGLLLVLLQERFSNLSPEALARFNACPVDELPDMGRSLLRAKSLKELGLED